MMTFAEFGRVCKRQCRYWVDTTRRLFAAAEDRRDFVVDFFIYQLDALSAIERDEYKGHIIAMMKEGRRLNLTLDAILKEMEYFRLEFVKTLQDEPEEKIKLFFPEHPKQTGDLPKLKVIIRYLIRYNMARYAAQVIREHFPLSLVGKPQHALLDALQIIPFEIIEVESSPQLAEPVKAMPEASKGNKSKQRRTEYPEEMNSHETAEYLSTTVDSLYQLTSTRKIPHYKRGRKLMFRKSELAIWRIEKVLSDEELSIESATHLLPKRKKRK